MSETISKDEFEILKSFMNQNDFSMNNDDFKKLYPPNSEIRISAVRLINELHFLEYAPVRDENKNILSYDMNKIQITPNGRFAYKLFKDNARKERKDLIIDKAIPLCSLIISIVSLLKSYGFGIEDIVTWCTQLLKR